MSPSLNPPTKRALICGAGKIGRGFLGQLLHQSGYELSFLDKNADLVRLLNDRREYRVETAGDEEATETIPVAKAYNIDDRAALEILANQIDVLVLSVGANNIEWATQYLAGVLTSRKRPLNCLICENALRPAETMRRVLKEVGSALLKPGRLGLVETQVLRTGMLPSDDVLQRDPLAVKLSKACSLPADADAFVDEVPVITGLDPKPNFAHELRRKLYTFNGLNGPISYVGFANGYRILHEAARAPELQPFVEEVMDESTHGLIAKYGWNRDQHLAFQRMAYDKYRDSAIADTLERNARDTARKLAPGERLLGPALLCLEHGKMPHGYVRAIAAAIDYRGADDGGMDDRSTERVQTLLREKGIRVVLREICGLTDDSPIADAVEQAWREKTYLIPRGG